MASSSTSDDSVCIGRLVLGTGDELASTIEAIKVVKAGRSDATLG